MPIIRDFLEEWWKDETGEKVPVDILDTIMKALEQDAADFMASEYLREFQEPVVEQLQALRLGKPGKSLGSLKKALSPAQKAIKLKSLKSSQKAIQRLKGLRKGAGTLKKGSKGYRQLQKTLRATQKVGKVGKNLGRGKGFLKGMAGLCRKYPKTCAAAGLLTVGTIYNEEIRDWLEDFVEGGTGAEAGPGKELPADMYTARWREEQGLPPIPGTLAAYRASKKGK